MSKNHAFKRRTERYVQRSLRNPIGSEHVDLPYCTEQATIGYCCSTIVTGISEWHVEPMEHTEDTRKSVSAFQAPIREDTEHRLAVTTTTRPARDPMNSDATGGCVRAYWIRRWILMRRGYARVRGATAADHLVAVQ